MKLTSPAFKQGEAIPKKHTCEGSDTSPTLSWTDVPQRTKSFALIVDDPDAPPGTWVHWVLFDIPGDARGMEEGSAKTAQLPNGAKNGASWGVDSFSRMGYSGPCPPAGKPHRYFFKLFALDVKLGLPPKSTVAQVEKAMSGHVLGKAELMGTFGR